MSWSGNFDRLSGLSSSTNKAIFYFLGFVLDPKMGSTFRTNFAASGKIFAGRHRASESESAAKKTHDMLQSDDFLLTCCLCYTGAHAPPDSTALAYSQRQKQQNCHDLQQSTPTTLKGTEMPRLATTSHLLLRSRFASEVLYMANGIGFGPVRVVPEYVRLTWQVQRLVRSISGILNVALSFFVLSVCLSVCLAGWVSGLVGWFVGWLICLVCFFLVLFRFGLV